MKLSTEQLTRMSHLLDEVLDADDAGREQWLRALPPEHRDLEPALRRTLLPRRWRRRVRRLDGAAGARGRHRRQRPVRRRPLGTVPAGAPARRRRHGRGVAGRARRRCVQARGGAQDAVAPGMARGPGRTLRGRTRHPGRAAASPHRALLRRRRRAPMAGRTWRSSTCKATRCCSGPTSAACRCARASSCSCRCCRRCSTRTSKGVLHRDIKPRNVLVTDGGQTKLLDFGIARLIHRAPEADLTQRFGRALTPGYASPEQIKGEAIDASSDVYLARRRVARAAVRPAARARTDGPEHAARRGERRCARRQHRSHRARTEGRSRRDHAQGVVARAGRSLRQRRCDGARPAPVPGGRAGAGAAGHADLSRGQVPRAPPLGGGAGARTRGGRDRRGMGAAGAAPSRFRGDRTRRRPPPRRCCRRCRRTSRSPCCRSPT